MSLLRPSCIALLVFLVSTAPAFAADWVVAQLTGEAWIAPKNAPAVRAAVGMTVPDEATFTTARHARARLERGQESILVSPSTVLTPDTSFFGWTTIEHQVGRITLDVDKRNVQHLSVETPFLAAVVKGTQFTVSVSRSRADVQVSRGLVGVADFRSGQTADIAPGQRAAVNATGEGGLQVGGAGRGPEVQQGQSRAPLVELVSAQASAAKAADSASKAERSSESDGGQAGQSGKASGTAAQGGHGSGGFAGGGNGQGGGSSGNGGGTGGPGGGSGGYGGGADRGGGSSAGGGQGGGGASGGGSAGGASGGGGQGAGVSSGGPDRGGPDGSKGGDRGDGGGQGGDGGGRGNGRGRD